MTGPVAPAAEPPARPETTIAGLDRRLTRLEVLVLVGVGVQVVPSAYAVGGSYGAALAAAGLAVLHGLLA